MMDKSWINKPRNTKDYLDGVANFVKSANEKASINGKLYCPCRKCFNRSLLAPEIVEEHLVWNGFLLGYTEWVLHGESLSGTSYEAHHSRDIQCNLGSTNVLDPVGQDAMRDLVQDVFRFNSENLEQSSDNDDMEYLGESNEGQEANGAFDRSMPSFDKDTTRYHNLLQDCDKELYPGCKSFSKISFLVHLFHLKCLNGWSGKSFSMLLQLLRDAFPEGTSLPLSSYEAKKLIKELGLGYEKIHACENDCMLYWGERANQDFCHVCSSSRWVKSKDSNVDLLSKEDDMLSKKKPTKVLRYFPLIPRLKRLYMSSKTAASMRWHVEGRTKDGKLRHPADGLAWKSFDSRYPDFSSDPRSVRLGLTSDGFNPFRTMNSTYSTWPVLLIPYNLPPWLCMKRSSFILSMVIPGVKGPGNDNDVYLQPLIEELKQLWEGVEAFDSFGKQNFNLRAALLWTISDFPAYANLSGWSTKGRVACPCCGNSTHSRWLKHGRKFCYMGHRRWLDPNHPFRFQKDQFDGTIELQSAPFPSSGADVLKQLEGIRFMYGKTSKSSRKRAIDNPTYKKVVEEVDTEYQAMLFEDVDDCIEDAHQLDELENDDGTQQPATDDIVQHAWKKRSIFFDLPYWEHNLIRHNLDLMHIEKNVCDNLIGTILNFSGRTKDNLKSRLDLKDMNIRHDLHPKMLPNNKTQLPLACYTLSTDEKVVFLTVLKNLKVPDGYASNISRRVNLKEKTLSNLKSHDGHILMQEILPIALRASMSGEVVSVVLELSSIFKALCSKTIDPQELDQLESRTALNLCHMEKIFPPSFFTIMVHLIIHLTHEIKLGGPVQYRWMYPIERNLMRLKSYVRNKAQPEGSIAEGYLAEECLTFCSRYLEDVETVFTRPQRNCDNIDNAEVYMFSSGGRILGKVESVLLDEIALAQAHRYVLLHCEKISNYRSNFLIAQRRANRNIRANKRIEHEWLAEKFPEWLIKQVPKMAESKCSDEIIAIARGPNKIVRKFNGFLTNGYRYHTKGREKFRQTQNSGVSVEADGQTYFGVLSDIYELDYFGSFKIVLFRCDWVDITSPRGFKIGIDGVILVNFSKLIHTGQLLQDDPFVFPSQVKQVFYVQDPKNNEWSYVIWTRPRDLYEAGERLDMEDEETYTQCAPWNITINDELRDCISWVRTDVETGSDN